MKTLVLCVIVGLANADIGLVQRGYEYKIPHTTYGVPTHNIQTESVSSGVNNVASTSAGVHNYGAQATQTGQEFAFTSQGNNAFNSGQASHASQGYQVPTYHSQPSSGIKYEHQSQGASYVQQSQASNIGQQAGFQQSGYQTSVPYVSTVHQEHSYQQNYVQQQPQIFRHVYVHAAPEEHEEKVYRQAYVPQPPQKHYKIIFIKAPTQSDGSVNVIPPHPQTEEKTIVYVLVKKQDGQNEIVVPKAPVHKPTKPEVYFIKYDTKKAGINEQGVINNIVSNLGQSGTGHLSGVTVTDASGAVLSDEQSSGIASSISSSTSSGVVGGSITAAGHNTGYTQVSDIPYTTGTSSSQSSYNQGDQYTYTQGVQSDQSSSGVAASGIASHEHESNNIHSSIGLPHETYGPPKFRV